MQIVDLVGRGRKDILVTASTGVWFRYYWNGSAMASVSTGLSAGSGWSEWADVDGDGRPDFLWLGPDASGYFTKLYVQLNTSAGGAFSVSSTATLAWTSPTTCPVYSNCFWIGAAFPPNSNQTMDQMGVDFNGDGRQDVVVQVSSYYYYQGGYYSPVTYTTLMANGASFTAGSTSPVAPGGFANINDDKCVDAIYGQNLNTSACNGASWSTVNSNYPILALADWNGDGRKDVIINYGGVVGIEYSTGTGLTAPVVTAIPVNGTFILDKDGDGAPDIGSVTGTGITYNLHGSVGTFPPDVMLSVTNGFGVTTGITYKMANMGTSVANTPVYPSQESGPVSVVDVVTLQAETGDPVYALTYTQTYTYSKGVTNAQGRGFQGFPSVTVTDSRVGALQRTTQYMTASPYSGMPSEIDVYQPDGTTLLQKTVNTYATQNLGGGAWPWRYFPYLATTITTNYELTGSSHPAISNTAKAYTYSAADGTYGNLTSVAAVVTDTDSNSPYNTKAWGSTTSYSYSYGTGVSSWCLGIPTQVQVVNTTPALNGVAAGSITRTTSNTGIDYAKCRIAQSIVEPTSTAYKVTEDVDYDSFGNVWRDTVTGANNGSGVVMPSRQSIATWGTTGQFKMSVTNPLGQATQYDYDFNVGQQSKVTDPNGIVTQWTYDGFGRSVSENRPDGTSTTTEYKDCSTVTGGCQNGDPASGVTSINKMVVVVTKKDTGGTAFRDDLTYLDVLGRTIVTKSKMPNGSYSRVGTQYDPLGRTRRTTSPCDMASCVTYWTTNTFDALGRLTQQQRPTNDQPDSPITTTASVAYQGRSTVRTDANGKNSTQIAMVTGQLGRSMDHDGYLQDFVYDPFGSLVLVVDNGNPNGNPVSTANTLFQATYAYGVSALQTDVTDMDLDVGTAAGQHRHTTYNALGEVVSQTDARGSTISYDPFDALGRPTRRVEATSAGADLVTNWTWGTSATGHEIGQLVGVTAAGTQTYTESRAYDGYGRLTNRTLVGNAFDLSYNSYGSLDTLTYPVSTNTCRFAVKYGYAAGVMISATDSSASGACGSTGTVI